MGFIFQFVGGMGFQFLDIGMVFVAISLHLSIDLLFDSMLFGSLVQHFVLT